MMPLAGVEVHASLEQLEVKAMGAFIVNFHIRGSDQAAIAKKIHELRYDHVWVTNPKHEWISLYDESASCQDELRIKEVGAALSASLKQPLIAFLVHDSDFLCYWLYEEGQLVDAFNSCPDYFENSDDLETEYEGDPEKLLPYCTPDTTVSKLVAILSAEATFAEEQLAQLAVLLGIDEERALTDYQMLGDDVDPAAFDAVFIGPLPNGQAGSPRRPAFSIHREDVDEADDFDDEADEQDCGSQVNLKNLSKLSEQLKLMLGMSGQMADVDPRVQQLVDAAAQGDLKSIDEAIEAGANINGLAPVSVTAQGAGPSASPLAAMGFKPYFNALVAAIIYKQPEALDFLLARGANVNVECPLLGTAVHVAATQGQAGILRALLERGGDANRLNQQGQTPREAVQAIFGIYEQIRQQQLKLKIKTPSFEPPNVDGLRQCLEMLQDTSER